MNLEEYPDQDGMKVWLSEDEVELLLEHYDDTEKRVALRSERGVASGQTKRCGPLLKMLSTPTPAPCPGSRVPRPGSAEFGGDFLVE